MLVASLLDVVGDQQHVGATSPFTRYDTSLKAPRSSLKSHLTRQVAVLDAREKRPCRLASYHTERGESPGAWIGSGLAGIDGLSAGDAVAAEQMRALFGAGMHPRAAQRLEKLAAADLTDANIEAANSAGAHSMQGYRTVSVVIAYRAAHPLGSDQRGAPGTDPCWVVPPKSVGYGESVKSNRSGLPFVSTISTP
jgi:hypothetical protein